MGSEEQESPDRSSFRVSLLDEEKEASASPIERLKVVTKWQRVSIALICLFSIALGIFYALLIYEIENQVEDANKVCSSSDPGADRYEEPSSQFVNNYFYNITNPRDIIDGGQAELHEIGPYVFDFQNHKGNIVYDDVENTVSSQSWSEIAAVPSSSCEGCDANGELLAYNIAYQFLLGNALNEAVLMLNIICTPEQFANIYNSSLPYCTEAERKDPDQNCRCCATMPNTPNATSCSDVASIQSQPGGILSMLSKYDGGYKISDDPIPAFPFVDGVYTALMRRATPIQILAGSASAYVGFVATNRAILNGDTERLMDNAALTAQMRDVCYPLYCPSYQDLAATFLETFDFSVFQTVSCKGLVPDTATLMSELGMSQEEADTYRYLEGAECNTISPSVILAGLVTATQGTMVCANSSDVMPCCPVSFQAGATAGSGIGCLQFVGGVFTDKRVFSIEEAEAQNPGSINAHKTGCAPENEKFEQTMFRGESNFSLWYTPEDYVAGSVPMSWADPSVVLYGSNSPPDGNMKIGFVSGKQFTFREGRGVTSDFLDYQLTDGDPLSTNDELWVPYKRSAMNTVYEGSERIKNIHANNFYPEFAVDHSVEGTEAYETSGQNPFPNVHSLVYIIPGRPVITSQPNFYWTETPESLSQTDNTERLAAAGGGVSLYRTRDGYPSGQLLTEPELITTETWEQYGHDYYGGFQSIEPATGGTIGGALANMASTFSWNCNPTMAAGFCNIMGLEDDGTMCYSSLVPGVMYPCSAANVFIPRVQGGKVLPIWWIYADPDPGDQLDDLVLALDLRFAFSILVLVVPLLSFFGIIAIVVYAVKTTPSKDERSDDVAYDGVSTD